jgi:hypothetical protein
MALGGTPKAGKENFKAVLKEYGLWGDFVRERERLKKQGVPPRQAWESLAPSFAAQVVSGIEYREREGLGGTGVGNPSVRRMFEDIASGTAGFGITFSALTALKPSLVNRESTLAMNTLMWVAEHVGDPTVNIGSAPSRAALNMLEWARESRDRFFLEMTRFLVRKAEKQTEADEQRTKDDGILEGLEDILHRIKMRGQKAMEELRQQQNGVDSTRNRDVVQAGSEGTA